jgi:hypothetical protein
MKATSIPVWVALVALQLCTPGRSVAADQPPETFPSVTFKQGKVLVPKDGKMIEPTNDVQVSVAIIQTNGAFAINKGKERQLLEGQVIDAGGMLTSPDGSVVPIKDHLVVRNGRVQLVRDGVGTPLVTEFALPDRSKVTPDANLRATDGKVKRLLDGQLIKLDGTTLPVTDTASLQGGKVVLYKDGGRFELRRDQAMAMSDGSRVNGDGTVYKADGTRVVLREGEILKLEGVKTLR